MAIESQKGLTLVLDTATNSCSVAIFSEMGFLFQDYQEIRRGHTDVLVPMINDLLSKNNFAYADIKQIVTTVGPGAFTGLRVGISTAKGLSISLKAKIFGITTTSALAKSLLTTIQADTDLVIQENSRILAIIDAKRSDVYTQVFSMDLEEITQANAELPQDFVESLDDSYHYYIVSDCLDYVESEFQACNINYTPVKTNLNAKSVGDMFFMNIKHNRTLLPSNPIYIRPPDAIIPKNGGRLINNPK